MARFHELGWHFAMAVRAVFVSVCGWRGLIWGAVQERSVPLQGNAVTQACSMLREFPAPPRGAPCGEPHKVQQGVSRGFRQHGEAGVSDRMRSACVTASPCKAMLLLSACERSHAIRLRNSTRLQAGTRPARDEQRCNAPPSGPQHPYTDTKTALS